ncbi:SIMPL domain-containing protein [Aestuariibacter sp. GS-14]|uniref:SIMPL domain-containing protein n=2 Tax=Alteromonadaceae TaxID=72275 RepID=UPI00112DEA5B|nr:SIMPL domain-containing protein [Aestuariibacter sp. GS-14]TPV62188.1 SIMPL domain-containing protein [Aestuariibacter sp. GS-14]
MNKGAAAILAIGLVAGLSALGSLTGSALLEAKQWERSVVVKGLSEQEYLADQVIWPVQFIEAGNDLTALYASTARNSELVKQFLLQQGIDEASITIGLPEVTDKLAQRYGGNEDVTFRYSATQTVTVYTQNVPTVRLAMQHMSELLAKGVALSTESYQARTEFMFTRLNEVKPAMIEEATVNAREVAEKFANDSNSTLGKIKRANQGQFSISERDSQHPHIKIVRVVSTIEYTLVD